METTNATKGKGSIVYGNNTGVDTTNFHSHFVALIENGDPLPEEIADLFKVEVLVGYNEDGTNRGIIDWA